MQALILAGGKGTRLRPLTVYTPKPIVPMMNRAFLLYQLDLLKKAGITDITLSLSYQPDKIEHVLGNGSEYGVSIRYISESSPMGTAGAFKLAMDGMSEAAIVFNGDILTDIDVGKMIAAHQTSAAHATIALTRVDEPSRYGVADMSDDRRIIGFVEKPSGEAAANTINAGIYILEPEILRSIPAGVNSSFEYDIFPALLGSDPGVRGYILDDVYWRDIGNPQSYLEAHHDFLAGRIQMPAEIASGTYDAATRSDIDHTSVIGEGCSIKPGARISNSVIGPGVHIEEKAIVQDSVIWSHTRVAGAAEVQSSVIGRSCHIGRNAYVGAGSALGDKTTLTDYTHV